MSDTIAARTCSAGRREAGSLRDPCGGSRARGGAVVYLLPSSISHGAGSSFESDERPLAIRTGRFDGPGAVDDTRAAAVAPTSAPLRRAEATVRQRQAGPKSRVAPQRSKYLWRRLFAMSLVAVTGAVIWSAVDRMILAASMPRISPDCTIAAVRASQARVALAAANVVPGGASADQSGRRVSMVPPQVGYCGQIYVVRPGDTVWSIAERYSGSADPRALADELQAQAGGTMLQPGQQLAVP
jgi:hypothetical protein